MSRMMSVALIAAFTLAGAAPAPAQAQKQKSQSASSSSKLSTKKSAAQAQSVPSRPAGISAAEQRAFDRAAQSNH